MDTWWFAWCVVPFLIFLARLVDVSLGTLRMIFVSKGYRLHAPLVGFFEVIIWLLAIRQILNHVSNPACYIAYGLGYAVGNYIGIRLDERLSLGMALVRIVPKLDNALLIMRLRELGFGASSIDIEGMSGRQKMILTIVKRKDLAEVMELIRQCNPNAFVTVDEVKSAKEGYFRVSNDAKGYPLANIKAAFLSKK